MRRARVLHFVTGGFSGATQVAADLVRAHRDNRIFEARLVLRQKRHTDPLRIEALRREGLEVDVVTDALHSLTMWQLRRLCLQWKPDILVAHGFSEHLWGRFAGLWAGVPHLVHVEHNSRERYTWWRLAQARWLASRTDRIIGCSEGVKASLLALGMPPEKTIAISNGIKLEPYREAALRPLAQREPGIVMAARFARQKDHTTLLKALQVLRQRGLTPTCWLPGGGRTRVRERMERLASRLGVQEQVRFLGFHGDVPGLLMRNRICVLASHYEGMPLSLIEGMAAGCVVVGSQVPGVQEVVEHGRNGLLVAHQNAASLADALTLLLSDDALAQRLAQQGMQDASALYSLERMTAAYEREFAAILDGQLPLRAEANSSAEAKVC
ncbi:glycosyl transferase family 1 [Lampropedia cohaerens]|uniref:Glycosyl transferase family 1 n=1 Tax=Lampropedia cohaerens TaxID=1610491 RepID=A0A0U1Q386_9BURK|nr:glycosyl transferase family 1 [Lampropedia cohaerens]